MTIAAVFGVITQTGLVPRGALRLEERERLGELASIRTIALAGFAGRDGWDAFAKSPEAADGAAHPLDRWSRRVIEALARELGAKALFPFGGPPFWPFQQWARRAEPVQPSPIRPSDPSALWAVAFLRRRAWLSRGARRARTGRDPESVRILALVSKTTTGAPMTLETN